MNKTTKTIIAVAGILIVAIAVYSNQATNIVIPPNDTSVTTDLSKRWFTDQQVKLGENIFKNNCAICHGEKAEKTINWKQTLPDGSYPPPPLNGSAHAWHHNYINLFEIITDGGKSYKGKMPSFRDKLTATQRQNVISYFQSFWSDEKYGIWIKNGGLKDKTK
jgi:mono/diheme cytochrome c family protein